MPQMPKASLFLREGFLLKHQRSGIVGSPCFPLSDNQKGGRAQWIHLAQEVPHLHRMWDKDRVECKGSGRLPLLWAACKAKASLILFF